jgi:hypothetical protein
LRFRDLVGQTIALANPRRAILVMALAPAEAQHGRHLLRDPSLGGPPSRSELRRPSLGEDDRRESAHELVHERLGQSLTLLSFEVAEHPRGDQPMIGQPHPDFRQRPSQIMVSSDLVVVLADRL